MSGKPETVSAVFPSKYLSAADLARPVVLRVAAVDVEEFRQQGGAKEWRPVGRFATLGGQATHKALIANKSQCRALAQLANSERFADWPGVAVQLAPGRAQNGKATILIQAPPTQEPPAAENGRKQQQARQR